MRTKKRWKVLGVIITALIFITGAVYYFFFTTDGARFLMSQILKPLIDPRDMVVGRMEGNVAGQLSLVDLEIEKVDWLPEGYILRAQKVDVYYSAPDMDALNVEVHHGRLLLPRQGAVVFDGAYQQGALDFEVYASALDLADMLRLVPAFEKESGLRGTIGKIEAEITGRLEHPQIFADLTIERLVTRGFALEEIVGEIFVTVQGLKDLHPRLEGEISIQSGRLMAGAVCVELKPGRVILTQDMEDPRLRLHGRCVVEGVVIDIFVEGSAKRPELRLISDPSLPQEQLMVMVATGKKWQGTEQAIRDGVLSADMAKDFVDYFLLGGRGTKFFRMMGVKDISIQYDQEKQGIELTEDLRPDLSLKYGYQTTMEGQDKLGAQKDTQTFGAAYQITPLFRLEGETELLTDKNDEQSNTTIANAIWLKYIKRF